MSERERFDRLRLIRSPRIGPVSYRQLLARFGTAGEALRALPDLAARGGGKASVADAATVEREIAASRKLGGRYLLMGDPDYPFLLDQMEGAPPALIVRGPGVEGRRGPPGPARRGGPDFFGGSTACIPFSGEWPSPYKTGSFMGRTVSCGRLREWAEPHKEKLTAGRGVSPGAWRKQGGSANVFRADEGCAAAQGNTLGSRGRG